MAKKKESPKAFENVEETLTRTEQFLEDNYKQVLYVLAGIVVLAGLVWLSKIYLNNRNEEALSQMYQAEIYFEKDSLNLALNGDGNYMGFLEIADSYKMTASANLANYYAGLCYLHLGQFEDAIDYLSKFNGKGSVFTTQAIGSIGDAWVELGDTEKGLKKYNEAINSTDNTFLLPVYLMKAATLHEMEGDSANALVLYKRIRDEFPDSSEGSSIEKYISRLELTN